MVTDGITRNSPDAGEIASQIVEIGMKEVARGKTDEPRALPSRAYDELWLNPDKLNGLATCITGIIKPNREAAMHIVGDPETAEYSVNTYFTKYPNPALVPQNVHFELLNALLDEQATKETPAGQQDLERLWKRAQSENRSQMRINGGLQCTHFLGTSGNYKFRKPSALWTLAANSWFFAGSDGLSPLFIQEKYFIQDFLDGTDDPAAVAHYFSEWLDLNGPDNATGIVIRVD